METRVGENRNQRLKFKTLHTPQTEHKKQHQLKKDPVGSGHGPLPKL